MHPNHQSHLVRNYKRLDSYDEKLFRDLKMVKYPVLAIEPAQTLQNKLLQFAKNQKLYPQMQQKLINEHKLNAYRKIRGDGNCFIRALAYNILSSSKDLSDIQQTFYLLKDIQLTSCHQKSIPKQFRPFYKDDLLKEILRENWGLNVRHFKHLQKMNNKRILSRMFRKYPYLDFIVILYFRALCLKGLQKHKSQVKQFMKGTEQDQIRTYGQESEGVLLDICSRYMKITIDVYEVRSSQIKHYTYKKTNFLSFGGSNNQVSLLFYENHYDIMQELTQKQLNQQRGDSKIQQQEYYSIVNDKMVEGVCIQCNRHVPIYEENYLCEQCFNMSRNQLLNTIRAGKFVKGNCRQCGRRDVKVQEMIQICQGCMRKQQLAQQSSILKGTYKNVQKPQQQQQQQYFLNQQLEQIDFCLQCDRRQRIDPVTKLCFNCKRIQQSVLKRQQERRQRRLIQQTQKLNNKCPDCRQPINSQYHEFKCVKKLTAARIGIEKKHQHYQENKCRNCTQLKLSQQLVDGLCSKCQKRARQQRDRIRVDNQKRRQQPIKQLGSRIYENSQKCIQCQKPAYVSKLQGGLCTKCKLYKRS